MWVNNMYYFNYIKTFISFLIYFRRSSNRPIVCGKIAFSLGEGNSQSSSSYRLMSSPHSLMVVKQIPYSIMIEGYKLAKSSRRTSLHFLFNCVKNLVFYVYKKPVIKPFNWIQNKPSRILCFFPLSKCAFVEFIEFLFDYWFWCEVFV